MKINKYTFRLLSILLMSLPTSMLFSQILSLDFLPIIGIPEPPLSEMFLYVPDNSNSMTIQEKSNLKFSYDTNIDFNKDEYIDRGGFNTNLDYITNNFKLGYSPLPHLYGTASVLLVRGGDNAVFFDSKIREGGIGVGSYYFKALGNIFKKKNIFNRTSNWMMPKKGILVNALLGYNRGKISHDKNYGGVGYGEFHLNKFYGQVGLDYQARIWGITGTARIGILNYGNTYLEGNSLYEFEQAVNILSEKNSFTFSELSFRFYLGMRLGQVYFKGVKSKTDSKLDYFVLPDYWNVGAVLDI